MAAETNEISPIVIIKRVLWYLLGLLEVLLAFRFLFKLLGANANSGFVEFVYALSSIFVMPFEAIFPEPQTNVNVFETSTIMAMLVFGILTYFLVLLLNVVTQPPAVEEDTDQSPPPQQ